MRKRMEFRKYQDGGRVAADEAAIADVPRQLQTDEPTVALKAQVAALQAAEAAPGAAQPERSDDVHKRRVEQVAAWIQRGVPEPDVRFLSDNPSLVDRPDVLNIAAKQAMDAGYERSTPEYFSALKDNFERLVSAPSPTAVDRVVAEARASIPAENVFDHENSRLVVTPRRVSVSAPPSRGDTIAASYMGGRDYDLDRGRVTLTPKQKEAAQISGCSEFEYATQLLRLRERKAGGDYGGSP